METTVGKRRRRLLHACGVSAITIAHKACNRAEEVHGPTGSLAHRIASFAEPIVVPMVSQWLAILSFADDRILATEDVVEMLFPPSAYVFDTIESFVHIPDALPGIFDSGVDMMIRRVPFLQWALTLLIWELNFLLSAFTYWGPDDAAKEKEITVDIKCNEIACTNATSNHALNHEDQFAPKTALIQEEHEYEDEVSINKPFLSPASVPVSEHEDEVIRNLASMDKYSNPPLAPVGDPKTLPTEAESKKTGTETERASIEGGETVKQFKITYKEVLEMGNNGETEKKEGGVGKEEPEKPMVTVSVCEKKKPTKAEVATKAEVGTDDPNDLTMKDFPILELFDAGWHMETHRERR